MAHASDASSSTGYIALLRGNANFRNLWYGQVVSLLGDWFNLIASAALVATLTGSGTAVGGLFVIRMLAPFLIAPVAGVAADRYNRKWILILSDFARAITLLGFLFVRDAGDVWLLYALTALSAGISGFFFPTRSALLPDLVNRRELGAANALSSATWSVMLALGTAIGGFIAGWFGVYAAFVIDAGTFLLSAWFIWRIVYTPARSTQVDASLSHFFRQYAEGLGYLRDHRDIFNIMLHKSFVSLLMWGPFQVIQVILGEQLYVIGENGGISMGLFFAVTGLGTGIGPIVIRRFTGDRDRAMRRAILFSYVLAIAAIALMATMASLGVLLVGSLLRGVAGGTIWVFSTQLLLQLLPDEVRGRVFATEFASFTLAGALGAAMVGLGLDYTSLGVGGVIAALAILNLLPVLWWGRWLRVGQVQAGESVAVVVDKGAP